MTQQEVLTQAAWLSAFIGRLELQEKLSDAPPVQGGSDEEVCQHDRVNLDLSRYQMVA
jgi:hypothetical protein